MSGFVLATGRLRVASLALLCAAALLPGGIAHAKSTLRLAHASSTTSLIQQASQMFADEVQKRTKGEITIRIYPDAQLGDEGPIADGVGSGSIDIGLGGVVDGIDPKLNAVTLPFLFANAKAAHNFLDSAEGKKLFSTGGSRGFYMLGALDSGFRQFANSARAIKSPQDLQGLKLRTPPNPVILATIKRLGALPQSIPFGEVYTSLQAKVVDGVEPEIRDFYDQKWYESVKFLSISNYIWTPNYWFMNKAKFDALPEDQRKAIDEAAVVTTRWYRGALDQVYADILAKLKAQGVQVNEVDPAPFRAMVKPVYDQFGAEWGVELVERVRKSAAGE
ncbi:TRAP transporter substrate-binding protein [Xanthobacteraceae bacterium Astr-EGSB]|uniref:TRAP transporter substrate-binding protein n=1 Tax=Astrobacterium formosum TaxID=3069710 RepID=UPI0027B39F46|nr:TRAP transporter substrate-binding protein [Xanthobacteraceae bacterium Astr-EGSB]